MQKSEVLGSCRDIVVESFPSELEAFEELGEIYYENFNVSVKDDQISATRRHAAGAEIIGAVVHFPAIIAAISALVTSGKKVSNSKSKDSNQQLAQTTKDLAELLIRGGVDPERALKQAERTATRLHRDQ